MTDKENKTGRFSKNLLSLKVQLQSLLDEAGGEHVIALLDSLCSLNGTEQKVALKVLKRVVDRLSLREGRLFTRNEKQMKELEDFLFNDIVREIEDNNEDSKNQKTGKLSLVPGGKDLLKKQPLKLSDLRSKKEPHLKPVLN